MATQQKNIGILAMEIYFPPTCLKQKHGNTDIEGVDSTNACYGGTAALFNCVNWVESSSWDGRYGLVVYAEGPARPTGGAAAIAMLVWPDAPIVFESKIRDGKLSQTCYVMALDTCYKSLCNKYEKLEGKQFSMVDAAYFVFHSPYNKLVQRSFGRLVFNDFLRNASSIDESAKKLLAPLESLTGDESYQSRDLEKAGQRVIMFSYCSGLTATMFSLKFNEGQHPFSLSNIASVMNVAEKLKLRHAFTPEKFVEIMQLMEHRYGAKDFVTSKDCSLLAPGTYYLTEVDSKYRRFYAKKAPEHGQASQQVAKPFYDEKVEPTTLIPKQVGNMYTASLYAVFASLLHNKHDTLTPPNVTLSPDGRQKGSMFAISEGVDQDSHFTNNNNNNNNKPSVFPPSGVWGENNPRMYPNETVNKKLKVLEDAMRSLWVLGSSQSVKHEELCAFPEIELPLGYKIPKFEKFDGPGNTFFHLKTYCEKLDGVGKNEGIQVKLFSQSLSEKVLEWNAKQDMTKWCTWDDLANAFEDHYKFYVNIIPDKISIAKLRQKSNENFRKCHTLERISDQGTSSYGRS
ncbi:hypothetical protein BC332_23827 [Capsicum chinense]|nr:hypothetical protein BC332_23827 [Capsicum chinense]